MDKQKITDQVEMARCAVGFLMSGSQCDKKQWLGLGSAARRSNQSLSDLLAACK